MGVSFFEGTQCSVGLKEKQKEEKPPYVFVLPGGGPTIKRRTQMQHPKQISVMQQACPDPWRAWLGFPHRTGSLPSSCCP